MTTKKNCSPNKFDISEYSEQLGRSYESLANESVYLSFHHTYLIWEECKKAVGIEEGQRIYAAFWVDYAKLIIRAVLEKMGLKCIPDLSTFGRVMQCITNGAPSLYDIIIDKPDMHVGHIAWCANPGMNRFPGAGYNTGSYLRAEGYIAPPYLEAYLDAAKELGLRKDIVIDLNSAMCMDCSKSACQYVFHTPDADLSCLPALPEKYIYDEFSTENPLPHVLKKLNRTFKEQANSSVPGFFIGDYFGWLQMFKNKFNRSGYLSLWKRLFLQWKNEALINMRLAPPSNIEQLGMVIQYCMGKRFTPYKIIISKDMIYLSSRLNLFLNLKLEIYSKEYFEDIMTVEREVIQEIINTSQIKEKVYVEFVSNMLSGDSETCIQIVIK